jgi:hypothetical protein
MTTPASGQPLVKELLRRVPEFAAVSDDDPALPYVVFGSFALFVRHRARDATSSQLLARAFAFINDVAMSTDPDELDLLTVGFLEVLTDDEDCIRLVEPLLSDETSALLRRVREWWG